MKKRVVKRIIMNVFLLLIIVLPISTNAQTISGMYTQLAELERQQANVNNGKKLTQNQITNLNNDIANINSNITKTENDIKEAEANIKDSEKKIDDKKDETNEMLKYLQITNGENVYLEYIFKADSYTDLIYRYSVVTRMSDYNNELIDELNRLIKELEDKKADLNKKQVELSNQKQQLSTKLATLNANLKELNEEGTSISDDIKSLKLDINKYEKMGCSKNEEVNACIIREEQRKAAARKASSSSNSSSGPIIAGWNLPVKGGTITSQFQVVRTDCYGCGGSSHRGIDIGVREGTPVYAAANGEVALVITSGSSMSCGGIKVYVYHYVNGNLYTTVYMHLLSANVSYGEQVTPGTIIGYSGGGSTAASNGGYDRCTTGPHLHFGVSYGNNVASFNANAFNPRQLSILSGASNGVYVSR